MEDLINLVVNNGLGVASFIALILTSLVIRVERLESTKKDDE